MGTILRKIIVWLLMLIYSLVKMCCFAQRYPDTAYLYKIESFDDKKLDEIIRWGVGSDRETYGLAYQAKAYYCKGMDKEALDKVNEAIDVINHYMKICPYKTDFSGL